MEPSKYRDNNTRMAKNGYYTVPNNMAVETEDVVSSTNTELIELVNRFPIDPEEVRMEAAEFVNSEDFISVQDMPTSESIIATIEGGVRRLPNSRIHFS